MIEIGVCPAPAITFYGDIFLNVPKDRYLPFLVKERGMPKLVTSDQRYKLRRTYFKTFIRLIRFFEEIYPQSWVNTSESIAERRRTGLYSTKVEWNVPRCSNVLRVSVLQHERSFCLEFWFRSIVIKFLHSMKIQIMALFIKIFTWKFNFTKFYHSTSVDSE